MKILYLALTFLICSSVFGQIEQDVNKTSGTESNTISDIDSIRFNANQTEMEIILNNGNIESHTIGDINNVTFSGELVGVVDNLDCAGSTNTGSLVEGVAASGVSADIDYTGGNTGFHNGQTINSTGVTGLTATLNAGNFANGAGTLNYTITGTPNSNGTANFAIQIGGLSCTLQIPVDAGAISSLDCAGATINGTLVEGVSASGVSADIDYTGGNAGSHNGQTVNSAGVTGLTATLNAGNFANGAGTLNYTITGTPNSNGTASFAILIGGQNCTLEITVDAAPLAIGDNHEGGIIFYLDGNGGGLIAAPSDQSSAIWGCNGIYLGGTTAAIGTGNQNTNIILNQCGWNSAAGVCETLTLNGYNDWFLPSIDELSLMYDNIGPGNVLGLGNIGNFITAGYWSSTEDSADWAFYFTFNAGAAALSAKSNNPRVRAIREF